jgi:hypothetical protein
MDVSYTLRAADGKEYGPVTLVQVVAWVHEGRVSESTELRRTDMQHWAAAREFAELKFLFAPDSPDPGSEAPQIMAPTADASRAVLVSRMKSGASWFYWIAALSLVNSVSAAVGSDWRFVLGLGITQIIDVLGSNLGGAGRMIVLMLDLLVAGGLVLLGLLGSKGRLWTFIVGMVLLALDSILFVRAGDWIGMGFHAFVLYCLFRGMQACRSLRE